MRLLISILLNGILVYAIATLLPGVYVENIWMAIVTGLVLGIINFTIKPIVTILTLPVTIFTLGLFLLVINAAMVLLADFVVPGFDVEGWGWALIFSLLLALLNGILGLPAGREGL